MKHNTPDLLKFKKLQARLKESRRSVVGLLELLWIETQKNCPDGAIGKFDDDEIAILCDWSGDASTLVDALVDCEWLDRHDEHRLVIHDWHIHAPNYIKGNLAKHGKDFASTLPKQPAKQPASEGPSEVAKQPAISTVPPNQTKPDLTEPDQPNTTSESESGYPPAFEAWWKLYPRKEGKGAALKAFKAALKNATNEQLMDAVTAYAASDQGRGEFCPHPSTWLNKRKWEDDRTTWTKRSGPGQRHDPSIDRPVVGWS